MSSIDGASTTIPATGSETTVTTITAETTTSDATAVTSATASSGETPLTTETAQLYPVVVDGKLGYINNQGEMVIQPQFVDWPYSQFSEGLAPVSVGGKFGYIDGPAAMVIEPQFDIADPFSEGLAAVGRRQRSLGLHRQDRHRRRPDAVRAAPGTFSEGLCAVTVDDRLKGGKLQNEYIDKTGAVVIGPFEWSTELLRRAGGGGVRGRTMP